SLSSFGAFASGSIIVNNHIRTSGGGSVNLLAGWSGGESDPALALDPQSAWDFYVGQGAFGVNGGSVIIGNSAMNRHVEVGSRYGDTNVAGYDVRVIGSNTNSVLRYSMIGFHDGGQVFGPRLNKGGNFRLDMKVGAASGSGAWLLSDGLNGLGQAAAGVSDPIVGVAGQNEVDVNGDGIMDGVRGINSTGVVAESFIPYANHYNSALTGNWWWQQIEDAGLQNRNNPGLNLTIAGTIQTADPLNLGGLRPENGAGSAVDGAHINVVARGAVTLLSGAGNEETSATIGHGGPNRSNWGGGGTSIRDIGNEDVSNAGFSIRTGTDVNQLIEQGQIERRWSFNGSTADRNATAIGRLAPVYGNINVLAGVDTGNPIQINRADGTVTAQFGTVGDVILRANQSFKTSSPASNSPAHIGHGGVGQFGEFYGNITVEAAGSVTLEAGEATRSAAVIGHSSFGHAFWDAPSNVDQQIRFFATTGDFDNPNLRRGELFTGVASTGLDPSLDPAATLRYTLGDGFAYDNAGTWVFVGHTAGSGNFVPIATDSGGATLTGQFVNFNAVGGAESQRVIIMNPLLYTRGTAGGGVHSSNLANSQGYNTLAPLTLAPVGPIQVDALEGFTIKGFHGDIKVYAHNGNISLKAFSTDSSITGNLPRDSRFAAIGHGGAEFTYGATGSGFKNLIGTPVVPGITAGSVTGTIDAREIVNFRITGSNGIGSVTTQSGNESYINAVGSGLSRYGTNFMTITGDIDVDAAGDITLVGGNDVWDYTRIGHGGKELVDYETSSFILGDIRVHAGGNVNLIGGGEITNFVRAGNVSQSAWAQIGHGGVNSGFMGFFGDIEVVAGGDVLLRNGAYRRSFAKIGHQGQDDWGQVGGDYVRNEHFWYDGVESTIDSVLNTTTASVTYASSNGGVNGFRDFTAGGAGDLVGADRRTANVSVTAGGSVTLDHLQEGLRQPPGRNGGVGDVENQSLGILTRDSYTQIGHGGINADILNANNFSSNYGSKVGDIFVAANGGDLILENGTGQQRWTRIGHGVGQSDRVDDGINVGLVRALELVGDISVYASGDIRLDADAADENERDENTNALFGAPAPSRINPVAIGHGGPYDNLDLVVLSNGEDVKGIAASSNITAVAGGSLWVLGGKGVESSYAQLGHGFSSDQGNDRSYRLGLATGFAGDINVSVEGDITIKAGDNAWSEQPSGIGDDEGRSVTGAFAAIGHGGYQVDAPSSGDIKVYAKNDLSIVAQERTDPFTDDGGQSPYNIANPDTDAVASGFNFAKIGHFSAENGNRQTNFNDDVREADQEGDITVVVGRDIRIAGGTTPDVDLQTIYGSFAQIGHGGPSIVGNLEGDITVLAGRDVTVTQGSEIDASSTTTRSLNNYAMIGNGDYLFDTSGNALSIFNDAGGYRKGDIVVATGRHITLNGALVGHADPEVATNQQLTEGNTLLAVSRRNPFYGGGGRLTATNESVITSGGFGVGSQAMFFMPARSNNKMDGTTRINEVSTPFEIAPGNFAAPFNKDNGILAGRADEVYLTPDLWWDQAGLAAAGGFPGGGVFPTDAASGQGGALATVNSPGGLFNLAGMSSGDLGGSVPLYRDANGISGAGHYTLYYDAVEAVSNKLPAQPNDPHIPLPLDIFDFFGLSFAETFDAFFREDDLFTDGVGGYGNELYPLLALFERDEETLEESGAWRLENSLDNLFGDRRDSGSEEERDEEREDRIARGSGGGPVGMTFYIFEPGTNRYSSYRVFGNQITSFYPVN
ncbi:MAG: hypothetical protein KDN18_17700, partial [Verrucomicrobiae bacterium]|nr:hypothetical protein [Verrucomicrobiae bacterium]